MMTPEMLAECQQAIDDAIAHSCLLDRGGREVRIFKNGVYEEVGRAVLPHLTALLAAARERDRLASRHWTCNKCGGSWNCDRADVPKDRGNSTPVHGCPYCERDRLAGELAVLTADFADKCEVIADLRAELAAAFPESPAPPPASEHARYMCVTPGCKGEHQTKRDVCPEPSDIDEAVFEAAYREMDPCLGRERQRLAQAVTAAVRKDREIRSKRAGVVGEDVLHDMLDQRSDETWTTQVERAKDTLRSLGIEVTP